MRSHRSRKPRIVLVQAPAFNGAWPSGGLALIYAHLKAVGIAPAIHESNLRVQKRLAQASGLPVDAVRYGWVDDFFERAAAIPGFGDAAVAEEAEAILAREPDVAAFHVLEATQAFSLALARRIKSLSPRTLTVFGGPQCLRDVAAEELVRDPGVDAVALGEADRSLLEFVRDWRPSAGAPRTRGMLIKEEGRIFDGGDPEEVEDLDALPFMDFSGFDESSYDSPYLFITSSRSCVRKCAFCTHIIQRKTFRAMSAARTAAEIRHHLELHPEKCRVEFGDSLINGDVARLLELSDLLRDVRLDRALGKQRHDLGWGGMAIVHRTMSPAVLGRLRQGGCSTLEYGLESGSQRVVDLMGKNFRVADAAQVLRDTKKAGIHGQVFLMAGFPGETEKDFQATVDFVTRHAGDIGGVFLSICEIQKGSALHRDPARFGIRAPVVDGRRWETSDGSNTYALRWDRYERLVKMARKLGLPVRNGDFPATRVFATAS